MSSGIQNKFLRYAPRDGLGDPPHNNFFQRLHLDPWLLFYISLIAILGCITLYSASGENTLLVSKQVMSFAIGLIIMVGLAQVSPKFYQALSPSFYIFGLISLVAVFLFGETRLGAQRWIAIPGIGSIQPSEFMKLAMPMMAAWYLSKYPMPPTLLRIVIILILTIVPFLMIAKQPDLGTSALVLASGIFVLFLSGLSWWFISGTLVLASVFIPISWQFVLHDYQKKRVLTLFDPQSDALGSGWNIIQSKIAIGSGGTSGKGFLSGTQSHLHFLPEGHTDFIIAAYSEEFGFLGIILLILLYFAIIIRTMQISMQSFDNYGKLLAGGLGLAFFVYVFVNAGMVSGILPVTGIPLPFMSYGGTAVITLMASFGIVMSIHTHK
ncbi:MULTISPECIES: rod shape-determining protein RodA [unclassified Acinetobacter]|uniref:rod shape-determining protein RodA n=1 Tax=unclassified Acinetobacter TaxID=196816 RepID=UPI00293458FD|nr:MULTISPECIES: rod shape-determining protein RodA [unclassified Acinetobacter]WOE31674.1 rod shape-determining protein RodA [Acinetobacter sp. SAAs470]WOE37139.1 rod shape-determining protein RodA [Acinetobacter sp. SAAs474]